MSGAPFQPIPAAAARALAEDYGKDLVIVLGFDHRSGLLTTTTFGVAPRDKQTAAVMGEVAAAAVGADLARRETYEDFRATAEAEYRARIDELERELAELRRRTS